MRLAIEGRRHELDMSQEALASASGTSLSTVSRIERGLYVGPRMVHKIERALGWKRGAIDAIRHGAPADAQATPDGLGVVERDVEYHERPLAPFMRTAGGLEIFSDEWLDRVSEEFADDQEMLDQIAQITSVTRRKMRQLEREKAAKERSKTERDSADETA